MAISSIKVTLPCDIQSVWEIVTSLDNYAWRSNIKKIEVLNANEFVEYTKEDYKTKFTVTCAEPYQRWEFDLENDRIKGHWMGIFAEHKKETTIEFTEEIYAKKLYLKPFIKMYLKKQQEIYIADLKNVLDV
ncbi:MAG: SRPBCC family protein [Lachnospiraceae bacterium]|nr:SRPBCC family protein [Lachnospiraceae bacterium]